MTNHILQKSLFRTMPASFFALTTSYVQRTLLPLLCVAALAPAVLTIASCTSGALPENHITDVTAITEVFGDGEKLAAVVIAYDAEILHQSLSTKDFAVTERTVRAVYVNDAPEQPNSVKQKGMFVIVALEPLPLEDNSVDPHPEDGTVAEREAKGMTGPVLGSRGNPLPRAVISAEVQQTGKIKTADGRTYGASKKIASSHTRQLVVEEFIQDTFSDADGQQLMYNLYIPKNYNEQISYPLVLFMHDAGAVSPEIKTTLVQGRGAIAFAEARWQTQHECFVLAPQYDTVIVDDNYQYGPELDRTIHLIAALAKTYSIDTKRIYNTGQSMGGMTAIAMDVRYPDFFAASYLVACKWNAAVTAPLGNQNIWAVASEGDPGAYPSMAEILGDLETRGATVTRLTLDTEQAQTALNERVQAMINDDCHIYYTIYSGGSHRSTWQHAYDMVPALEWLFLQHK